MKDELGNLFNLIWVMRFMCPSCGHTVSILPSFCVPYKRQSSAAIALCLHCVLYLNMSIRSSFGMFSGRVLSYRSMLQAWLRQWHENRAVLTQDGLPRLGVSLPAGGHVQSHPSPYVDEESIRCYQAVSALAAPCPICDSVRCPRTVFVRVQPKLTENYPPIGLFRPSLTPRPD